MSGGGGGGAASAVFYAEKYHPIQAGSIDGTDVAPHDNAVLRALLCSTAGLYDPFGDPKATGDPYCTVFVGRLSRYTDDETLRKEMSRYGRVKSMRLVRDIVTGASRGYAFVEYETDREMRRAYEDAHHSIIDGSEVLVDYYRQQLMPGWIPRRSGGGLGGKKESGQLRFGGRERPFRAPLRPIPYDELKRLGIPPPPEGRYMTRYQVPPPPRRKSSDIYREESPPKRRSKDRVDSSHYRRYCSPTQDDDSTVSTHRRKGSHDRREETERRTRAYISREAGSYSKRSPTEDDGDRRKRRRSREPGELSPYKEDDDNSKRGRSSVEPGFSPYQSHHHRHHRERHDSSSHSRHGERRHQDDRGNHSRNRRSESRDYSH
ncbi:hypothetical protein DAI22_09g162900 [Oryza sativa Japonica Group]|nr:hypothetical protein DAI22_09g162900 [Oryza sativa Japonica Group]